MVKSQEGLVLSCNSLPRRLKEGLQPHLLPQWCTVQPPGVNGTRKGAREGATVWLRHCAEKESSDLHWGRVMSNTLRTGDRHSSTSPLRFISSTVSLSPDEKQSKPDRLASGEGSAFLGQPERIHHLPAVPGQPAVHQPWYPALREDVRGRFHQHRRAQHHQGSYLVWETREWSERDVCFVSTKLL